MSTAVVHSTDSAVAYFDNFRIEAIDARKVDVAKKYLSGDYRQLKTFKDNRRNMVELVEIDGTRYVIKAPRNELRMFRMKLKTLIRPGEATSTYRNINRLRQEGFDAYAQPYAAMVERKHGLIQRSYILYEYIEGYVPDDDDPAMHSLVKKMHSMGVFHGDCRRSNFLVSDSGIKIIDTKAQKMSFGNFQAHYDIFIMNDDNYREHPYPKNIFFYMAMMVRLYKRNKPGKLYRKLKKSVSDHIFG